MLSCGSGSPSGRSCRLSAGARGRRAGGDSAGGGGAQETRLPGDLAGASGIFWLGCRSGSDPISARVSEPGPSLALPTPAHAQQELQATHPRPLCGHAHQASGARPRATCL